jgi:hypothetical protein
MPLSDDAKAIVVSNLVIANELRRLVLATKDSAFGNEYGHEISDIYQKIMARLSDLTESPQKIR